VQVRDVSIDVAVATDADVGIMVWPGANGSLLITGLKEDSSAQASGLQPGDVLTMVDGIDILQLPAAQVSKMLSGPAGSEVTLTVSRMQDGVPTSISVTIIRDVYIEAIGAVITEGGVMVLTKAQKQVEDVLFGPFARMKVAEMPEPDELWEMLHKYVTSVGGTGKIGVQVFTQFVHWLSMQMLSKEAEREGASFGEPLTTPGFVVSAALTSPEGCFEFCADIIDIVVPSMCPELFRFLDHNEDGDLSKDEWLKLVSLMKEAVDDADDDDDGFLRGALDFVFMVMDKDNSKTLELDEVTGFMSKMLSIAFRVAHATLATLGRAAEQAAHQDAVEQAFALLDADHDGCLVPEEVFAGFPSELIDAVKQMPSAVEGYAAIATSKNSKLGTVVRGLRDFVGLTKHGVTSDFFFSKVKEAIMRGLKAELLKSPSIECLCSKYSRALTIQSFWQLDIAVPTLFVDARAEVEAGVASGKFDEHIRALSDAFFDLIDYDCDGRVSEAEVKVYTDLFLEECRSEEDAKRRLVAIFGAIDHNGNGSLSKNELMSFVGKVGRIATNVALLVLRVGSEIANSLSATALQQMFASYKAFRQQQGSSVTVMDAEEFYTLCSTRCVCVLARVCCVRVRVRMHVCK